MPATKAQIRQFIARRAAIKKAADSKTVAPVSASVVEVVERKPRTPIALSMTIKSVEERTGPKAGPFGYLKVAYVTKSGKPKTSATAMAFGEAYAKVKEFLVPDATVQALVTFNAKKGVGFSLNVVDIAA